MQERIAARKRNLKNKLKEEKEKIDQDIQSKDPLQEEELEKAKNQAMIQKNL